MAVGSESFHTRKYTQPSIKIKMNGIKKDCTNILPPVYMPQQPVEKQLMQKLAQKVVEENKLML